MWSLKCYSAQKHYLFSVQLIFSFLILVDTCPSATHHSYYLAKQGKCCLSLSSLTLITSEKPCQSCKKRKRKKRKREEKGKAGSKAKTEQVRMLLWFRLLQQGFPVGTSDKEPACQCRSCKRCGFNPWVGKIPWRKAWQPTPILLPGVIPWLQRILAVYSPWGCIESDNWSNLAHTSQKGDPTSVFDFALDFPREKR